MEERLLNFIENKNIFTMKTLFVFFLLAAFSMSVFAQTNVLNPLESTPYIEVTGDGEMEFVPDEIFISFTLKERMDGKTKITIEEQERELKQKLQKINFDLKNLTLADASADYTKIKWNKKDVIASKDFLLEVDKVSVLDQVFGILDEIKVFDADIYKTSHSQIEQFRKEVKIMAMKAAQEKAAYLLEAIGEKVGKPLYIQEREMYEPEVMPMIRGVANMSMKMEDASMPEPLPELSFKKIKLKYKVFARFAIQ
ncbi:MAG: hypothetical protein A2W90_05845 [Bacteroidetes bacterium GWF2_42_66]|nr:MAG: hypothetical protein A2W92_01225 [Bacteroidetes bacterium GWA2_42_15]OFY03566.1 MAG: hypothetical protein A2W89_18570 [Bacteroidetes bacterium GWE2_42_39]OFY45931.1 MAG: hypothetical protein A2W90_05845 [Bacteroidetes bacterium GWF2_42_66]HBL75173.1 hypothetical protein [Prolixibacteraceae bacterium]HCR89724.1 hypothetical protein [Prolixibacteraceae bacterium]